MEDQTPTPAAPESSAPQGGSSKTPEKQPMGWAWLIVVVIIVAGVLFVLQQRSPEGDAPKGEEVADVVEDKMEDGETDPSTVEAIDIPLVVTRPETPENLVEGSIFGLDWEIQADDLTKVTHTAVHWSTTSHPGDLGTDVGPDASGYEELTEAFVAGEFVVPNTFEDNISLSEGNAGKTLYLRAHAILLDKNYWSDEIAVPVVTIEEFQNKQK